MAWCRSLSSANLAYFWGKRKAGKIQYQNRMGICLSKYGDPGLGELARQGIRENGITHAAGALSLRSGIAADYVRRLAARCGLIRMIHWQRRRPRRKKPWKTAPINAKTPLNLFPFGRESPFRSVFYWWMILWIPDGP